MKITSLKPIHELSFAIGTLSSVIGKIPIKYSNKFDLHIHLGHLQNYCSDLNRAEWCGYITSYERINKRIQKNIIELERKIILCQLAI